MTTEGITGPYVASPGRQSWAVFVIVFEAILSVLCPLLIARFRHDRYFSVREVKYIAVSLFGASVGGIVYFIEEMFEPKMTSPYFHSDVPASYLPLGGALRCRTFFVFYYFVIPTFLLGMMMQGFVIRYLCDLEKLKAGVLRDDERINWQKDHRASGSYHGAAAAGVGHGSGPGSSGGSSGGNSGTASPSRTSLSSTPDEDALADYLSNLPANAFDIFQAKDKISGWNTSKMMVAAFTPNMIPLISILCGAFHILDESKCHYNLRDFTLFNVSSLMISVFAPVVYMLYRLIRVRENFGFIRQLLLFFAYTGPLALLYLINNFINEIFPMMPFFFPWIGGVVWRFQYIIIPCAAMQYRVMYPPKEEDSDLINSSSSLSSAPFETELITVHTPAASSSSDGVAVATTFSAASATSSSIADNATDATLTSSIASPTMSAAPQTATATATTTISADSTPAKAANPNVARLHAGGKKNSAANLLTPAELIAYVTSPGGKKSMMDFLQLEFASENLSFILAVADFQQQHPDILTAGKILQMFVKQGSPLEVNVSAQTRNKVIIEYESLIRLHSKVKEARMHSGSPATRASSGGKAIDDAAAPATTTAATAAAKTSTNADRMMKNRFEHEWPWQTIYRIVFLSGHFRIPDEVVDARVASAVADGSFAEKVRLAHAVAKMVQPGDHYRWGKLYRNTFVGSEAVTVMVDMSSSLGGTLTRKVAERQLEELRNFGLLHNAHYSCEFVDGPPLFCFDGDRLAAFKAKVDAMVESGTANAASASASASAADGIVAGAALLDEFRQRLFHVFDLAFDEVVSLIITDVVPRFRAKTGLSLKVIPADPSGTSPTTLKSFLHAAKKTSRASRGSFNSAPGDPLVM